MGEMMTTGIGDSIFSGKAICFSDSLWVNFSTPYVYPLVNIEKTIENHHVSWVNQRTFYGYV